MAKNSNFDTYTNEQDSVPRATAGTGTITQDNNGQIVGVGTAFTTEVNEGDWIYIKAINEFQRVNCITSDTSLSLDEAFAGAVAATAFHITPASRLVEISWIVTGNTDALIDGQAFSTDEGNTHTKSSKSTGSASGKNRYVDPIDIDASTNNTTVKVSTLN